MSKSDKTYEGAHSSAENHDDDNIHQARATPYHKARAFPGRNASPALMSALKAVDKLGKNMSRKPD